MEEEGRKLSVVCCIMYIYLLAGKKMVGVSYIVETERDKRVGGS